MVYLTTTRKIVSSDLNSKNKITGFDVLAIPIKKYTYSVITWTFKTWNDRDGNKTRTPIIINVILHPKADIDRLYITRKSGGRRLSQLEAAHTTTKYRSSKISSEISYKERCKDWREIRLLSSVIGTKVIRIAQGLRSELENCWKNKPPYKLQKMDKLKLIKISLNYSWK